MLHISIVNYNYRLIDLPVHDLTLYRLKTLACAIFYDISSLKIQNIHTFLLKFKFCLIRDKTFYVRILIKKCSLFKFVTIKRVPES